DRCRRAVVFVGGLEPASGKFIPLGTGFLAVKKGKYVGFQHIISARHVIEPIQGKVFIRVNTRDGGSKVLPTNRSDWIMNVDQRSYNDTAICRVALSQDT